MKQRFFKITYSRETHQRKNGQIGVLTYCKIEEKMRSGKYKQRLLNCSYDIRDAANETQPRRIAFTAPLTNGRAA